MEVVSKRAALLSNFEVLTLLRELENDHLARTKTALKVKKEEANSSGNQDIHDVQVSENLRTIEVEAIQYLTSDGQPTPYQTPEGIQQLTRALAPYGLTKAEKLQIVNIAPQSLPVLWAIIEELEDRMTPEQMQEITDLVQNSLSKTPQAPSTRHATPPATHDVVDDDAYAEDDEYMDVTNEVQFDDHGEGAGVEGDLDVEDD